MLGYVKISFVTRALENSQDVIAQTCVVFLHSITSFSGRIAVFRGALSASLDLHHVYQQRKRSHSDNVNRQYLRPAVNMERFAPCSPVPLKQCERFVHIATNLLLLRAFFKDDKDVMSAQSA